VIENKLKTRWGKERRSMQTASYICLPVSSERYELLRNDFLPPFERETEEKKQ
jgi:hypothetical protein